MNKISITAIVLIVVAIGVWIVSTSSSTTPPPAPDTTTTEPYGTTTVDETIPDVATPANTSTSTPSASVTKNNMHRVTIETNMGTIQFETYDADAPKTAANFVNLANKGFYNGTIFHRVIDGFMIQGGDPTGTGSGGPGYQFEDELNPATESYKNGYKTGVVAMANAGPNTNGSQFFIMLQDYPLPNAYTIFGHVVKGQDIVAKIGKTKTGAGDRPVEKVVMNKVTVEEVK